jgi:Flp pilus assembly protein TadD
MIYRLTLALLAACGILSGQARDATLDKALAAHQAGNFDAAVAGYREYLAKHPNAFEIRSNLGAALSRLGLYADAAKEYQAALKVAPNNPNIALNLAIARYKDGDIAEAANELLRLRTATGGNRQVDLLLSDCWLQMGQNKKVIDLLGPLEKKTPDDVGLAYVLGTALIRDKRTVEGERILNRIFSKGETAEGWLLMGSAKLSLAAVSDDFAGAVKDLSRAVELNPKLPTANALYGRALLGAGDAAGAVKAFRAELAVNPADFESLLNLAVLLKQGGESQEARKLLNSALRIRPGDGAVRYQLAVLDLEEGKTAEARSQLEGLVKESPDFVEGHVSLATVYYRLKMKAEGDRERAIVQKLNEAVQQKQRQEFPAGERKSQ